MDPRDIHPLIVRPHPLTDDGKYALIARAGDRLGDIIDLPDDAEVLAYVDGRPVCDGEWQHVCVDVDHVYELQVVVGRDAIGPLLAIAALVVAPFLAAAFVGTAAGFGIASSVAAGLGISLGAVTSGLTALIGAAGVLVFESAVSLLVSRNLAKVRAKLRASFLFRRDRTRLLATTIPVPLLLGSHRVFPYYASRPYTEYDEDGEQFLFLLFELGFGDVDVENVRFRETLTTEYQNVLESRAKPVTLVYGNVDTVEGGALEWDAMTMAGTPVVRTLAAGHIRIVADVAIQHYRIGSRNRIIGRDTNLRLEYSVAGAGSWTAITRTVETRDGADARNARRRSIELTDVANPMESYDIRVTLLTEDESEGSSTISFAAELAAVRGFAASRALFAGSNPLAIKAKADGQLRGSLPPVNMDIHQRVEAWDGTAWVVGRTSNPAYLGRAYLRGFRDEQNQLVAGMGEPDGAIEDDEFKQWGAFCTTNGLKCDIYITERLDHPEVLEIISQCGWGSIRKEGDKWGVVYEDENEPLTAIFTPDNVVAGSVEVVYNNDALADEIVGRFIDKDSSYQPNVLRRTTPGTMLPSRQVNLRLRGIVNGEHAAKELNQTAARQVYQNRTITLEGKIGTAAYVRRGAVVGLAHDLVGGTVGGRLLAIAANRRDLTLSMAVPLLGTIWVWDLNNDVVSTTYVATNGDGTAVQLSAALPDAPAGIDDDSNSYHFAAFSSVASQKKARVTEIESREGGGAKFTLVDEDQRLYDARTSDLNHPLVVSAVLDDLASIGALFITATATGGWVFSWPNHPSPLVNRYELRYGSVATGHDFPAMSSMHEGVLITTRFESASEPESGEWIFGVVGILDDGRQTSPFFKRVNLDEVDIIPRVEEVFTRTADDTVPAQLATTDTQKATDDYLPAGTTRLPVGPDETSPYEWRAFRSGLTRYWGEFSPWGRHEIYAAINVDDAVDEALMNNPTIDDLRDDVDEALAEILTIQGDVAGALTDILAD